MVYEKVQKDSSSWNPAFQHQKSESLFRSRPFSIPAEADTDSAQEQEIPTYSRADRDAISAKLLKSMDGNVQSQAETQSQKPDYEQSPAFDHHKSESFFQPRPFSIQPQADTDSAQEQEIPIYSRAERDAISAKLFKPMGENVQSQAETQSQKPDYEQSPAFDHHKSESFFRPRPFSIQPQADTEASQEQEIPAYSRAERDAISAKLFKPRDGNVQSQAETQSQKPDYEQSPAFDHHKSESFFRPRPFSIQPQADTKASEEQEIPIPAYSRADRDAISAKLLKSMGGDVQTQAETEGQKPESESEGLESDEVSPEAETLQRTSESPEAGDDDDNSANGGAIQRYGDTSESERHSQGMQAEESDEEKSLEAGAIQRQSELESPEDNVKSIQTKLTVGTPGDKYEQEADSVAAQVMSMSIPTAPSMPIQRQGEEEEQEPSVQRSSLADSITPLVQRLPEEQEEPLQAKSLLQRAENGNALAGSNVESQLNSSKGGGSPLPDEVRSFMEPRFGADFSSVRVHTDSTAVQMNKELGAQAFAHGSDIYYGAGKSPGNNELTAHELTHTIQQGGAVRLNKQVQRQAKEEEQETLQAKELPNNQEQVSLNKEVQPAEILAAKELPSHTPQLSLNKELRLKLEATDEETQAQPIQAKQYTSLDVSSVSPRIQGDFFGIPTSLEEAKRKILSPVAQLASGIPGYPLLKVIVGKDPISETPVERNATNLIQGVLSLVPKGQEFFANLQQSGAIDKAYNWFNEQITKLNLTWDTIKGLFKKAWDSLGMGDLVSPSGAFEKIKNVFTEPIGRIKNFAINAGTKVMEFVFEGVMGGGGAKVMGIIRSAGGVFNTIISDPIKFIGNLVGAVKGGFQKFSGNVNTHLKNGLVGWLFGALAGAGLALPAQFDLKGIVSLVIQVLGLTYQRLRGMLVKLIGEPKVAKLEKAFDFLMMIVTQGLGAAWQKITEFVGGLQEMVMGGIRDWVQNSIITAAITKLLSMFNPAGAIIQAVMAIYNTIMFFIERGSQIAAVGEAVFSSIGTIAAGNIAGAATYVEQTMGRTLPVVISFLARLIGLGGISEQIKAVIKKIQSPIETAMTKVANFVVEKGKSLLGKGKDNKDEQGKGKEGEGASEQEHPQLAKQAISELEKIDGEPKDYKILKQEKEAQAKQIEQTYTAKLKPGIKLSVQFNDAANDEKDGYIDFKVVIAPNTTTGSGSIPTGPVKPVDWTVGTSASTLIASGTRVSGHFPLDGASPKEVRYRMNGSSITSYIVYDDNGRAIKRVDVTGSAHAGVPTPHVVEYKHNKNPAGNIFVQAEKTVRPASTDEIP